MTRPSLASGSAGARSWSLSHAFGVAGVGGGLLSYGLSTATGTVYSQLTFDDGTGPALYVAGDFTVAGDVAANGIACRKSGKWQALGAGPGGRVYCMLGFNDGTGPALYAGGEFGVARWNGSSWATLVGLPATVTCLAAFDDGTGNALYAARMDPCCIGIVARYQGGAWTIVGSLSLPGFQGGYAATMAGFDDGSGPALYVAGGFSTVSGVTAPGIARWNGATWAPVGALVPGVLRTLVVFDDGTGAALYLGLTGVGGAPGLRRWSPPTSTWAALPAGFLGAVAGLTVYHGPAFARGLYVAGNFVIGGPGTTPVARWNAGTATPLPITTDGAVRSLEIFDDGTGTSMFVGGAFTKAGAVDASNLARWNGTSVFRVGAGVNAPATALLVHDDGSGAALYAGGEFTSITSSSQAHVARWNGSAWASLQSGVDGPVLALAEFNDGSGLALYAGGRFANAGGVPASNVARWNGTQWSALGSGVQLPGSPALAEVRAFSVFNDGSGPALYAAGDFTIAGGVTATGIARWNGGAWSAVGSASTGPVSALGQFDDGSGLALYAGGTFTTSGAGGIASVARWNGSQWSAVPGNPLAAGTFSVPAVRALTTFDDGTGPALYVGGEFTTPLNGGTQNVARWNGAQWQGLGAGLTGVTTATVAPTVDALVVHDDGTGPALYAGGRFSTSGTATTFNDLARWSGAGWQRVRGGVRGTNDPVVHALCSFNDGPGTALFVGGRFTLADGIASAYLARWALPRADLAFVQTGGSGSPVMVNQRFLIPGAEYYNVFSFQPAPLGVGTGPFGGLYASNPAALLAQLQIPLGILPFHFVATSTSVSMGPYALPVGTPIEAIDFRLVGGAPGCLSHVVAYLVQ